MSVLLICNPSHDPYWDMSGLWLQIIFLPLSHELAIIITLLVGVWSVNGPSSLYYLLKAQQMIMLEKRDFGCDRSWGRLEVLANSLKGCWRQLLVEKIIIQFIDNSSGVYPCSQRGNCINRATDWDRTQIYTDMWIIFERNGIFFSFTEKLLNNEYHEILVLWKTVAEFSLYFYINRNRL